MGKKSKEKKQQEHADKIMKLVETGNKYFTLEDMTLVLSTIALAVNMSSYGTKHKVTVDQFGNMARQLANGIDGMAQRPEDFFKVMDIAMRVKEMTDSENEVKH